MFMHGPSMHFSCESVAIAFTYEIRISSPGSARITGGSSRPLNEKAAFPVCGSLIAVSSMGERASGGFLRSGCDATLPGAATACAVNRMLSHIAKHITQAKKIILADEVRLEIMVCSLRLIHRQAL